MSRFFGILVFAILAIIRGSIGAAAGPEPSPGKQVEVKSTDAADKASYNYLLFVPANYDKQEKWPLIVFLHGSGERGDSLELVKKHGPPKIVEGKPDFEFIVVSPQVPASARWEAEKVGQIVDQVAKSLKVDAERIYLTGLSMGGSGTWDTAAKYPERFAAIVPICGPGDLDAAETIKSIPCWVFHGAKDTPQSVQQNEEMVAALKKAGGQPKFTLYPEADHDSWTQSYNNPELYRWLLEQKRKSQ
jgi:predicted peptidase